MNAPLEKHVTADIMAFLKELGQYRCWYMKVHGGPYGRSGIPDIIGVLDGRLFAIEVKRPGRKGTATPLQMLELHKIRLAGGVAEIATSVEEAKEILGLS